MMYGITAAQNMKSNWKRCADLKTASKVLIFLQDNNITSIEELADKVSEIHHQRYDLAKQINKDNRRYETLTEHLTQVELYNKHKSIYRKYKEIDPKKRDSYKKKYADEITQYESSLKYLKGVLNGRDTIPEKQWRNELETIRNRKFAQYDEYCKLKDDVQKIEVLRRSADNLIKNIQPIQTVRKSHEFVM